MWYSIIRYGLVIIIILFIIFKKKNRNKKKIIIFLVITVLFCVSIFYIPFENVLISFSSPEAAFNYMYSGTIDFVIEGNKSTMIYYSHDGISKVIFPKSKTGWKLGSFFANNTVYSEISGDYVINIYRYNDINDYYVEVWDAFATEAIDVSDNKGSIFDKYIEKDKELYTSSIIYYSHITDYDNYELIINGKVIKITE